MLRTSISISKLSAADLVAASLCVPVDLVAPYTCLAFLRRCLRSVVTSLPSPYALFTTEPADEI